mmetsp:Transcript_31368/g.61107  ORF Transcript_31368/g.61107 Transcript_31368/m.61107 type:complete len:450 (-) Transcript_31368:163-1512(-)|eukprot:CAMPEP_0175124998 /NCGR_PEP_ID=MMETSP0087-20121206/3080_1 /TAXON_ID=136419 /ORGANISM="Unknown Unknown, Strain D1" /LENGTH=449 /DNA_ID=CAMNT_0016406803 /DNA_START=25 /DNA_END=1374 /DNA_ORIENTATION=+
MYEWGPVPTDIDDSAEKNSTSQELSHETTQNETPLNGTDKDSPSINEFDSFERHFADLMFAIKGGPYANLVPPPVKSAIEGLAFHGIQEFIPGDGDKPEWLFGVDDDDIFGMGKDGSNFHPYAAACHSLMSWFFIDPEMRGGKAVEGLPAVMKDSAKRVVMNVLDSMRGLRVVSRLLQAVHLLFNVIINPDEPSQPAPPTPSVSTKKLETCGNCSKELKEVSRCSRCKAVAYCNRHCQAANWKVHKPNCSAEALGQPQQEDDNKQEENKISLADKRQEAAYQVAAVLAVLEVVLTKGYTPSTPLADFCDLKESSLETFSLFFETLGDCLVDLTEADSFPAIALCCFSSIGILSKIPSISKAVLSSCHRAVSTFCQSKLVVDTPDTLGVDVLIYHLTQMLEADSMQGGLLLASSAPVKSLVHIFSNIQVLEEDSAAALDRCSQIIRCSAE